MTVFVLVGTGCTDTPRWGSWSSGPTKADIQTGLRRLDDYVYYPAFQVYFNAARGQYTFWDGQVWVTSHEPPQEIPVELLEIAASVPLRFEQGARWQHAEVVRLYPPDWTSPEGTLVSTQ